MCAPIPKNKWSWKASRCKGCGTRSKKGRNRHKGNGLCFRCFDKKRLENPKRKENVRNAGLRFFEKNKNKDWFKKANYEATKKYNDKNKDNPEFIKHRRKIKNEYYDKIKNEYWFKKMILVSQKKFRQKKYFREFINKNPKYLKKYQGGVQYRCEGCDKNCLITSPIKPKELNNKIEELNRFRKIVIEMCELIN